MFSREHVAHCGVRGTHQGLAVVDPSSVRCCSDEGRSGAARWGDLGGPTLAKARKLAIASIKAIADHQAANDLSCTQTALFALCRVAPGWMTPGWFISERFQ